ncbi:MAG TPA: MmgE/PrpD family protein [Bryobacteraceae bacterium]
MTRAYTKELVEFLAALDAPPEVFGRARYFLLDYLGVAIRGSLAESSAPIYKMIERIGAAGNSTVIGAGVRTSAGYAALANGGAAHAIELDDTHNAGSIHLGVVMFSTALALAEAIPDMAPEQFLIAVIAGYETAARIAMAVQPKEHYLLGFHPTATCGVFGAAVTASKLLGLTAEQMLSAVGIAGSMAAGSLEFLKEGSWTKRLHPGLAAQNGIQAAMLAADGFRGPSTILEGRDGFLSGYSRKPIPERITDGLGESFEIMRTSIKPHACCRYMQGPIDAILALVNEHGIKPDQVVNVEVAVLEAGWTLVAEPRAQKYKPQSIVDAQFSMPFGAAIAVLHRRAGLDEFTAENAQSNQVRRMMGKVTLLKDIRLDRNFPKEWNARVTIFLHDGRQYEKFVRHPKGDPENPLSWEELVAKFTSLASAVIPLDRCEQIVDHVSRGNPALLPAMCSTRVSEPRPSGSGF